MTQVVILSDTFEQFAKPLMEKLGWPTIFCNTLEVAPERRDHRLSDALPAVQADHGEGPPVHAAMRPSPAGDSFNDLGMIQASKAGFLFKSTQAIRADHPELPAFEEFGELLEAIKGAIG